jgi:hypothetical protein
MTNDRYFKIIAAVAGAVAAVVFAFNWQKFAFLFLLILWAVLAHFIPHIGR